MTKHHPLQRRMRTHRLFPRCSMDPKRNDLSLLCKQSPNNLRKDTLIIFEEEMEHCPGVQNIHLSLEIFETGIRFVEDVARAEFDSFARAPVEFLTEVNEILEEVDGDNSIGTVCVRRRRGGTHGRRFPLQSDIEMKILGADYSNSQGQRKVFLPCWRILEHLRIRHGDVRATPRNHHWQYIRKGESKSASLVINLGVPLVLALESPRGKQSISSPSRPV